MNMEEEVEGRRRREGWREQGGSGGDGEEKRKKEEENKVLKNQIERNFVKAKERHRYDDRYLFKKRIDPFRLFVVFLRNIYTLIMKDYFLESNCEKKISFDENRESRLKFKCFLIMKLWSISYQIYYHFVSMNFLHLIYKIHKCKRYLNIQVALLLNFI